MIPNFELVLDEAAVVPYRRTSTIPAEVSSGDATSQAYDGALTSNRIQKEDASDGFQIGNGTGVNTNAAVYHWFAIKTIAGQFAVGSFSGNGTSQSISGLGFQPVAVLDKTGGNSSVGSILGSCM